jgi:FixJ family two-component response regulator
LTIEIQIVCIAAPSVMDYGKVMMPGIVGIELQKTPYPGVVYNEIKKLDNRIKVCFLTADEIYYGLQADSFSSADLKCFIRKPIENEELIKCVHQIITAN